MNLSQFLSRPLGQQLQYVLQRGRFLAIRHNGDCSAVLYLVGGFFAEVWYSAADNHIVLVSGFSSLASLEPYLEMEDLGELMGRGVKKTCVVIQRLAVAWRVLNSQIKQAQKPTSAGRRGEQPEGAAREPARVEGTYYCKEKPSDAGGLSLQ